MSEPNAAQTKHWNEDAGPGWVARQVQIDRMLEQYCTRGIDAVAPVAGERALDIGCGCGATTIELASRVGSSGHVLGVDLSAPMLGRAKERCAELGLDQVELRQADAQRASLPSGHELAFSRFGVMFFDDPVDAFSNIAAALGPGGRIGFVCWQARDRNPWMAVPIAAALRHVAAPPPLPADAPGPWAFADPDRVRAILDASGFVDVRIDAFEPLLRVGGAPDLDGAVEYAADSGSVRTLLDGANEQVRAAVEDTIREALAPHATADGVMLPSATWVVTALIAA